MAWTEERVEKLKALWAQGLSAADVARRLGGDATRSSVIGKVHRLGIFRTHHNSVHAKTATRAAKARAKAKAPVVPLKAGPALPVIPIPDVSPDDIPTKTFNQVEDGYCKFRIDVPFANEPYGFCGKKALPQMSWCDQHLKRISHPDHYPTIRDKALEREKTKRKEKEPA